MIRARKKIFLLFLLLATLLCLGAIVIESRVHFIQRLVDNSVYDNRNHYLPCDRLPTEAEVQAVVQAHQAIIQAIMEVNPGLVGVDIDSSSCPGKADLLIWYASHQDRLAIESIIASDTFFGVPYRLENR
jgi:hypothetical protein